MLELIDIKKDYQVAGEAVHALRGVSLKFRKSEFVSILGASGCGKTTLLNIIGGLDKYTSGDLVIEGKSTKQFGDRDWDTYRNHSIGFIFQSYHLIPHQTILQNVELALTISGVGREERRQRAIEALEKVGLKDKINNRPNQLSGGQAQRVAIARALINDPEIVLADEPTGALDSKTSVQIMDLLSEIAKDRLVIMVTHNPELAEKYSTRIIRLLDGEVTDDSMPYDGADEAFETPAAENGAADGVGAPDGEGGADGNGGGSGISDGGSGEPPKKFKGKKKKSSMSIGMAFGLSAKNLLSKRKRTAMVSIAGSIGIIGVSMVLAISAGVQNYIDVMEDDMLSGNPLTVAETALDFNALMDLSNSMNENSDGKRKPEKIYVDSVLETLMGLGGAFTTNTITEDYVEYVDNMPAEYYNAIQYGYSFNIANNIYTDFRVADEDDINIEDYGVTEDTFKGGRVSITSLRQMYTSVLEEEKEYKKYAPLIGTAGSFGEIPNNYEYVLSQYDIIATSNGKSADEMTDNDLKEIFESKDSLIMVVADNAITDIALGQFGYMSEIEFLDFAYKALLKAQPENESALRNYKSEWIQEYLDGKDFSYFVGDNAKTFTWYPNDSIYTLDDKSETYSIEGYPVPLAPTYVYEDRAENLPDEGKIDMSVKVILQRKKGVNYGCLSSGLYYTNALTRHMLETSMASNIVRDMKSGENMPERLAVLDQKVGEGQIAYLPYNYDYTYIKTNPDTGRKQAYSKTATGYINQGSSAMATLMMSMMGAGSEDASSGPLISFISEAAFGPALLGGDDLPINIAIYPLSFDSKDFVTDWLDDWNDACEHKTDFTYVNRDGKTVTVSGLDDSLAIQYTDMVGLIINMINMMIKMITIALVAFTALSLVVSTVMIGIITYVSVVERIKEIGILRAVGARKKDIKRLFNAETFIIGLAAGLVGIIITYILSLILNLVISSLAAISAIAALPWWQAVIMVLVSVGLTLVSGLIPASAAAKKDPVVALRTE